MMGKKWRILFCSEQDRECPVTEFLSECAPAHQVKLLRILSLLEENGPVLPRPYADTLHDGIHELRVSLSRSQVRVLYFFCYETYIVLYHVFFKTTQRVPEKHIDKVIAYREKFLSRISRDQIKREAHALL